MRFTGEDVAIFTTWLAIVFASVVGMSLTFSARFDGMDNIRAVGGFTLLACAALMGLWLRWCFKVAVRDQIPLCECCSRVLIPDHGTQGGKHHA